MLSVFREPLDEGEEPRIAGYCIGFSKVPFPRFLNHVISQLGFETTQASLYFSLLLVETSPPVVPSAVVLIGLEPFLSGLLVRSLFFWLRRIILRWLTNAAFCLGNSAVGGVLSPGASLAMFCTVSLDRQPK